MSEPNVIRFQATAFEPSVSDDIALLTMDTTQDGRVTVWMQRRVFVALAEQMRRVLAEDTQDDPPPKAA